MTPSKKQHTNIIAEIGNTHEGSVGLAKQFIKSAAECGVDTVKFQTHIFEAESLPNAPNPPYFTGESRKEYFERTAFNLGQYKQLKEFAEKECHVRFISSPFSIEAVDLLEDLGIQEYKIPSGEVTNLPLLKRILRTNKPVLLSSGMSSWDELDRAVETLKLNGSSDLTILQCTSEYPCPPENAGLNILSEMKKRFNLPIGYSDHTLGTAIPVAAVVLGATVIEKHFTLSKRMYGSDAMNATEPHEFKKLVKAIRDIETSLHSTVNKDQKASELTIMKQTFEKSIVSASNLPKGHNIQDSDLAFKKPGSGIPAYSYQSLIGKVINKNIPQNHMFQLSDFT
ncbi:MAG: N-acetylneuraminate synthase family protein [Candidatus Margulisbacteria bacterium]|nr:N-acetylneuraminate synthase family protein [Candidatus Margulisiibacteriota bacterium]